MSEDDDIELIDEPCPKCGGSNVARKECTSFNCDEGFSDASYDDAINYMEGECLYPCDECRGQGCHVWCRDCGYDLLEKKFLSKQYEDEFNAKAHP